MKNKVKIGDAEFTLPFEAETGYGGDPAIVRDGTDVEFCYAEDWGGCGDAIAETIATALNEHFARLPESYKGDSK